MTVLTQPLAAGRAADTRWTPVCRLADLLPERGVCALADGAQVAVFRGHDGAVYAVSNYDPFSGAFVLSRGIMGSRGDVPTVASPIGKQVFALTTGQCLDQPAVSVPVARARVTGGVVEITGPVAGGGQAP
ncbi:MAG: nitrite reductase small subunit NirD [Gemmatimonadota bacterium]